MLEPGADPVVTVAFVAGHGIGTPAPTSFGGWVWFGSLGSDCYVARQIAWGAGLTEPAILIDTSTAGDSASTATEEFLYYRLDALGSV